MEAASTWIPPVSSKCLNKSLMFGNKAMFSNICNKANGYILPQFNNYNLTSDASKAKTFSKFYTSSVSDILILCI